MEPDIQMLANNLADLEGALISTFRFAPDSTITKVQAERDQARADLDAAWAKRRAEDKAGKHRKSREK